MKIWLQRKRIRSTAVSVTVYLLALSVLNTSMASAADKPKYLPALAPEVDTSISQPKPATAAPSGTAGGASPYTAAGNSGSSTDDQIKSLLREALERHNQGDAAGAERVFRKVLTLDPNNGDANFNLGALAEEHHDLNGALRYYSAAAKANPSDPDIADAVSSVKSQLRQQSATAQTQQQVQKKQRLGELGQEAAAAYKAGRYDEAIAKLQIVDKESPNDPNTIFALGQAYRGKGDKQRAHEYLAKAVSLVPENQLFSATLSLTDSDGGGRAQQQADGMPPAAPDYHAHNGPPQTAQHYPQNHSDWQDEGWQGANNQNNPNNPNNQDPMADGNGVRPFTDQGENQLEGRVANSNGMGGMGRGIGMSGLGIGLGGAALGIGALSLFNMMRGNSYGGIQSGMPYGGMPYSPYGYAPSPYGYSPYNNPYNNPYGNPYRMMRMGGRHGRW